MNVKCYVCGKEYVPNRNAFYEHKQNPEWRFFCSKKCQSDAKTTSKSCVCALCGEEIKRSLFQAKKSKSGLNFCNRSHNASYWNKNKKSGFRRSKLEGYLVKEINRKYSWLEVRTNEIGIVGLELDIYLPSLRLAFELNGIFHYEPIYGNDKFNRIQSNDQQKVQKCREQGIELCVLDVSSQKHFTEKSSQKFVDVVLSLIERVKERNGPVWVL